MTYSINMIKLLTVALVILETCLVSSPVQGCKVPTVEGLLSSGICHASQLDSNILCQRLCWYSTSCRSCSWDTRTSLCHLSKDSRETSPDAFSVSQHHIYSDVQKNPCLTTDHACKSRSCSEEEVCIPTEAAKSYICLKMVASASTAMTSPPESVTPPDSINSVEDTSNFDTTNMTLASTDMSTNSLSSGDAAPSITAADGVEVSDVIGTTITSIMITTTTATTESPETVGMTTANTNIQVASTSPAVSSPPMPGSVALPGSTSSVADTSTFDTGGTTLASTDISTNSLSSDDVATIITAGDGESPGTMGMTANTNLQEASTSTAITSPTVHGSVTSPELSTSSEDPSTSDATGTDNTPFTSTDVVTNSYSSGYATAITAAVNEVAGTDETTSTITTYIPTTARSTSSVTTESSPANSESSCIESCDGLPWGTYQCCSGCDRFCKCSGLGLTTELCSGGLVWDDILKNCGWPPSATCP